MDADPELALARLLREARIAALGTVHNGVAAFAMITVALVSEF